jgi:hypothetical protein
VDDETGTQPIEVEWLDAGPPTGGAFAGIRRGPSRWWYGLAALLIVAGLIIVKVEQSSQASASNTPQVSASTSSRAATPAITAPPSVQTLPTPNGNGGGTSDGSVSPTQPTSVLNVGHPLLDVPAGWELFARGDDEVLRIQLALGRITTTAVPGLTSTGPVSFVVGPHDAIVVPLDAVPAYVIPDGQPSTQLSKPVNIGGPALPGPDPNHFWLPTEDGEMSLLGFNGTKSSATIPVPSNVGLVQSDDAGGVLFYGTGGVYDARPDGVRRITTGTLVAAGPTRWLTIECDTAYNCAPTVINRTTGARRTLHVVGSTIDISQQPEDSAISPDGNTVAIIEDNDDSTASLFLLNLSSGAVITTGVAIDMEQGYQSNTFVWSPDSSSVFVADGKGHLLAVDRSTGKSITLTVDGVGMSQVAFRSA